MQRMLERFTPIRTAAMTMLAALLLPGATLLAQQSASLVRNGSFEEGPRTRSFLHPSGTHPE